MVLQSIFVVNKAGSLIFYRKFVDSTPVVSQNDQLHLASTFHGCVPRPIPRSRSAPRNPC
jgi:hypothetical protein